MQTYAVKLAPFAVNFLRHTNRDGATDALLALFRLRYGDELVWNRTEHEVILHGLTDAIIAARLAANAPDISLKERSIQEAALRGLEHARKAAEREMRS